MPTREPKPTPHEPDWAQIDALTDEEIDAQIAADPDAAPELTEAWFEQAEKLEPIDVKAIRARLCMSQLEFSRAFGLNLAALRDWEQRRHAPRGPALSLLRIIDREPDAARRALQAETLPTDADRERLGREREAIHRQQQELENKLQEIDREFAAIEAYETAKTGKAARRAQTSRQQRVRRGSCREELLNLIREGNGLSRGEILERMGLRGDKAGEASALAALDALTKRNQVQREGNRYRAPETAPRSIRKET